MTLEEAIEKIHNHLKSSKEDLEIQDFDFLSRLPICVEIDNYKLYLREITWQEALSVDKESYKSSQGKPYFSSEQEKRSIIKLALQKIEYQSEFIDYNFEEIAHNVIEQVWNEYQKYLHLSTSEINYIYKSAKKYFDSDNKDVFPVHPFIIEVDYMLRGVVSFSRNDFSKLSLRDFEALQLIMAARNEVVKTPTI